jgi:anti-sigma regulatory factor (Ser/Thr protein kinase)
VTDEVRLPPHPASVGRSRRFVREQLIALRLSAIADDAELVVSELVTNALIHTGTPITVRVGRSGHGARIEVADGSQVMPGLRSVSLMSTSGRGLTLVDHFAAAWGAESTSAGKVVWFFMRGAASEAG